MKTCLTWKSQEASLFLFSFCTFFFFFTEENILKNLFFCWYRNLWRTTGRKQGWPCFQRRDFSPQRWENTAFLPFPLRLPSRVKVGKEMCFIKLGLLTMLENLFVLWGIYNKGREKNAATRGVFLSQDLFLCCSSHYRNCGTWKKSCSTEEASPS